MCPGEAEQKVYHDPTGSVADTRRERTLLEREVLARHDAAEVGVNLEAARGIKTEKKHRTHTTVFLYNALAAFFCMSLQIKWTAEGCGLAALMSCYFVCVCVFF